MPLDFDAARRRVHDELDAADIAARERDAALAAEAAAFRQQAMALGREIVAALVAAGVPTMKKHVLLFGPRGGDLVGWELGAPGGAAPVNFVTPDGVLYEHRNRFHSPLPEMGSPTCRKFEGGNLYWFVPAIDGEPERWANVTQRVQDAVGYRLAEHERNPPVAPAPQPKKRRLLGGKR